MQKHEQGLFGTWEDYKSNIRSLLERARPIVPL